MEWSLINFYEICVVALRISGGLDAHVIEERVPALGFNDTMLPSCYDESADASVPECSILLSLYTSICLTAGLCVELSGKESLWSFGDTG